MYDYDWAFRLAGIGIVCGIVALIIIAFAIGKWLF